MHRVKHTADVVLGEIYERAHLERVREAALKNKRKIETDDVVPDELVAIAIEVFHQAQEILQRLLFILFVAVPVDAEDVLARFLHESGKFEARNRADVQRTRKHAARGGAEGAERVAAFFFGGDVFEIALLLFDAHIAESHQALELWSDSF